MESTSRPESTDDSRNIVSNKLDSIILLNYLAEGIENKLYTQNELNSDKIFPNIPRILSKLRLLSRVGLLDVKEYSLPFSDNYTRENRLNCMELIKTYQITSKGKDCINEMLSHVNSGYNRYNKLSEYFSVSHSNQEISEVLSHFKLII